MRKDASRKSFRRFKRPRIPGPFPGRRIVWIGIAALLVYLLVLSNFGLLRHWNLSREAAVIEARIAQLEARKDELEAQRGQLENETALERIAREEYGMVKKGEHVYRLTGSDVKDR